MSQTHTRERIRIAFDVESHKAQTDEIGGSTPEMWRNNDVQFELGFFFDGEPIDATPFQSIKLIVKEQSQRQSATPLMMATVAAADFTAPVFTTEEWENKETEHCKISFTAAETRLDLGGKDEKAFFLAVIATTADGKRITLGSTVLKLHHDGDDETSNVPPLGSSLIGIGAVYSGAGTYVLSGLTVGRAYSYTMGDDDTSLVNGSDTITESGNFTANGTSVTLHGTASALITATVRYPVYLTQEEADARYSRGDQPWRKSPNGRYMRVQGVDDNGKRIDQIIDLQAL